MYRRNHKSNIALVVCFTITSAAASNYDKQNPYACLAIADELRYTNVVKLLKIRLSNTDRKDAIEYCTTAELLKQTGNYLAADYYAQAIAADPAEPAYEIIYADYLRNFRGAGHPLFREAEMHYQRAIAKLNSIAGNGSDSVTRHTRDMLERGIVSLYQQDGLPLWYDPLARFSDGPNLYLSSSINFAVSTTDIDEIDDIRDFTSEALFAASPARLNRPLTKSELRNIIRKNNPQITSIACVCATDHGRPSN